MQQPRFVLDKFQIARVAQNDVLGTKESDIDRTSDAITTELARQIRAFHPVAPVIAQHTDFESQMNALFGLLNAYREFIDAFNAKERLLFSGSSDDYNAAHDRYQRARATLQTLGVSIYDA